MVVDVHGELCLASASQLLEASRSSTAASLGWSSTCGGSRSSTPPGYGCSKMQSRARHDEFDFAISVEGTPARTLQLVGLQDYFDRVPGKEIDACSPKTPAPTT